MTLRWAAWLALSLAMACGAVRAETSAPPPVADPVKVAWLQAHRVAQGPVAGPIMLNLPDDLLRAKLIMLGESHGSAAPQVLDLALLTELNRRIGLTDYLAEIDPIQAERLNSFLDTGNETALMRVFALWQPQAQWGNTAFVAKVRSIRALNLTLQPSRRIHFVGIDAVQDWPLLAEAMGRKGWPIDPASLEAAGKDKDRAALVLVALPAAPDASAWRRLRTSLELTTKGVGREALIFANYADVVRDGELGDRPAYGLWGYFHVLQGEVSGAQPFAARVRGSALPAAHALASIALFSLDSAVMVPMGAAAGDKHRLTTLNADGPMMSVPGIAELRAATSPDSLSVFALDAAGSPYRTSADLASIRSKLGQNLIALAGAVTTGLFQYAGVFRNSDWAPPLP